MKPSRPTRDQLANNGSKRRTGVDVSCRCCKTASQPEPLFVGATGGRYSLILIDSAAPVPTPSTLAFWQAELGAAIGSQYFLALRYPARLGDMMTLQSSPRRYDAGDRCHRGSHARSLRRPERVLAAAIAALGLTNGANAGAGDREAMWSLRAEGANGRPVRPGASAARRRGSWPSWSTRQGHANRELHRRARAPELAHRHHFVLQRPDHDLITITARLLHAVVMVVAWLCGKLRQVLENRQVAAEQTLGQTCRTISCREFLTGMAVNFEIAAIALIIGSGTRPARWRPAGWPAACSRRSPVSIICVDAGGADLRRHVLPAERHSA